MLEFKTSADAKKAKAIKFKVDDDTFTAYPPKDSAVAFLVASGSGKDSSEQMYEVLNFFRQILDEPSQEKFFDRLRDKNDTLSLSDAMDILTALLSEFSGRPTE